MTLAHADVTLKVDDNIKVAVLNGQQYNTSIFQPLQQTFVLQPGKHVITAKYERLYDNLRGDDHDYLRSANITVTADLQDNQTYRLAMPGQPEEYEEAKKYAKAPTLAVMKGSTVLAESKAQVQQNGLFSGLSSIFGGGDSAQVENQKAIAAVNSSSTTQASSNSAAIAPISTPVSSSQQNTDTLDNFMQLWLQATPSEREKIRQWIEK
ncbi:DUF2057 family protein [Psychrobacter raelei]|nr:MULTISPECIES: DUF2057 family protein [Psychrobacter]